MDRAWKVGHTLCGGNRGVISKGRIPLFRQPPCYMCNYHNPNPPPAVTGLTDQKCRCRRALWKESLYACLLALHSSPLGVQAGISVREASVSVIVSCTAGNAQTLCSLSHTCLRTYVALLLMHASCFIPSVLYVTTHPQSNGSGFRDS